MSEFMKSLSSFSGADLIVTFGPRPIAELQSISWAVQREKAPVYTLGSPDPRSFSRGKRGIAGSLIFAVFDRDALMDELKKVWDSIAPPAMFTAAGNMFYRESSVFESALQLTSWNDEAFQASNVGGNTAFGLTGQEGTSASNIAVPPGFKSLRHENILYPDMLPPFDITMTFANEYGQAAFQKIYDVDILNEGSGVSVDTIVMERQLTFIARRISPIMTGVYTHNTGDNKYGITKNS